MAIVILTTCITAAQTPKPADRLPPPGISVPEQDRKQLTAGAAALLEEIESLTASLTNQPALLALMPDVEIFHKAVAWALRYDEFFDLKQLEFAKTLLEQGNLRLQQVRAGQTPWLQATGLVVRGYRSRLDRSVQPYGIVVPSSWKPNEREPRRLDVWLAGRNEKRTELAFLAERESSPGPFTPPDAIVLHPYGRFCNANKFAGEIDVFEAMDAVRAHYLIDSNRIVVAGFSMGGASTWHLATHHPDVWCAASPGAGFAETAVFAKALLPGKEPPPWFEQKLWHWYDATAYAGNLFNCPTIAYSGEIDPQKQSADIMEHSMAAEGLKLERLIGPQTAHKYEPETEKELAARLDALAARGRTETPKELRFTTYTLQYPRLYWAQIERLGQHWERADVRAAIQNPGVLQVSTTNVTALRFFLDDLRTITIDRQKLKISNKTSTVGITVNKQGGRWTTGPEPESHGKRPGLTGPIDDAFMNSFLFVRPTGKPLNDQVGNWARDEFERATNMWRAVFRGTVPVEDDVHVSSEQVKSNNLVLWGDPSSNKLLAIMLDSLPLRWTKETLVFNGRTYDAANHAPILIFPNPLNPERYIVLNSGIDFRKDAYGSNALQTPKLPDWVIIDLRTPPGPRWPGGIAAAGFFDERWQLPY